MSLAVRKSIRSVQVFGRIQFKRFIKANPQYSEILKTEKDFNNLIKIFQDELVQEVLKNPYGISFPGTNAVVYIKNTGIPKVKPIDVKKSAELGQPVYHLNLATGGNMMRIVYLNNLFDSRVDNSNLFSLVKKKTFQKICSDNFKVSYMAYLKSYS